MSRYGRTAAEWHTLEAAGWDFLVRQALLQRTTTYTEMNDVLARRTGVREFDFSLDGERRAMGELLGQLVERTFGQAQLLISVVVQYLNAYDAGPRFYDLAQRKGLLRLRPSADEKLAFWVEHLKAVHSYPWLLWNVHALPAREFQRTNLIGLRSLAFQVAASQDTHQVTSSPRSSTVFR